MLDKLDGEESPTEPRLGLKLPMLRALGLDGALCRFAALLSLQDEEEELVQEDITGGGEDEDFRDSFLLWMKWHLGPYGQKPIVW